MSNYYPLHRPIPTLEFSLSLINLCIKIRNHVWL